MRKISLDFTTYPIGLLTMDEALLAGSSSSHETNKSFYLFNDYDYWLGSLKYFDVSYGHISQMDYYGYLSSESITSTLKIRPAISLKKSFTLSNQSGDGTTSTPFIVE